MTPFTLIYKTFGGQLLPWKKDTRGPYQDFFNCQVGDLIYMAGASMKGECELWTSGASTQLIGTYVRPATQAQKTGNWTRNEGLRNIRNSIWRVLAAGRVRVHIHGEGSAGTNHDWDFGAYHVRPGADNQYARWAMHTLGSSHGDISLGALAGNAYIANNYARPSENVSSIPPWSGVSATRWDSTLPETGTAHGNNRTTIWRAGATGGATIHGCGNYLLVSWVEPVIGPLFTNFVLM